MSIGFQQLTSAEIDLLLTFNEFNELVLPDLIPNGNNLLAKLIKQGIVLHSYPFKLSKKGVRLVKSYRNSHQI